MTRKKSRKNNICKYLKIIFCAVSLSLYSQIERDVKKYIPPLSESFIKISDMESLLIWSVASLNAPASISDIFIDGQNRAHFAYFDDSLGVPVYVVGKSGNFKRKAVDLEKSSGKLISMAVDTNAYNIHIAYEKFNKIWYANDNNNTFQNYAMDLREGIKIRTLKLVVSTFNSPILFFTDIGGALSVSRFYRDNFFSDFIYTNKKIENVYPIAEDDGYALYMKEYGTGNVFYGSRKTNTVFKFFDNNAIVTNANIVSVYHEAHNRFTIVYTTKENPSNIYYTKFYDGTFTSGVIKEEDKKISYIATTANYASQIVVLYVKEDGNKSLYMDAQTFDLSILGTSKGELSLTAGRYPYFYFLYYNDIFDELRLSRFNVSDIKRYRK